MAETCLVPSFPALFKSMSTMRQMCQSDKVIGLEAWAATLKVTGFFCSLFLCSFVCLYFRLFDFLFFVQFVFSGLVRISMRLSKSRISGHWS